MERELLSALGRYLVEGSLSDAHVLAQTGREPPLPILPQANVIKIGGQSFIDRGRARHAYSVGLDLGLPTGVLSVLGTFVSM